MEKKKLTDNIMSDLNITDFKFAVVYSPQLLKYKIQDGVVEISDDKHSLFVFNHNGEEVRLQVPKDKVYDTEIEATKYAIKIMTERQLSLSNQLRILDEQLKEYNDNINGETLS